MLTHKGTQTINTKRLILRRFVFNDAKAMFKNWVNDERVTHYLTWTPHKSLEITKQLLEIWCADYKNSNIYNWAIEYNGMPIGAITVVQTDEKSEWAELGYCIGYNYWNKGFMTEAVKGVVNYLFSEIGMNRIAISHAVKNPASGIVAQKCGFTFEGTKREYFKSFSGEFHEITYNGNLKREC
ncbi:MAG: GNAT family N-acetyltransferase, partial [Clostridiales bacterium]|nr:GNAT family N-acetyltransferase [Clostridiales bacterium]